MIIEDEKKLANWKIQKDMDELYKEELYQEYISNVPRKFSSDEIEIIQKMENKYKLNKLEEYEVFETKEDKKTGEKIKTGKINCPRLAKLLMEADSRHYIVIKDNQTIYVWNGSYYEPTGKSEIEKRVNYYLDDQCTEQRKKEVVGFIRNHEYTDREDLDPPEHLINFKNGILDRKTKQLLDHTPDIFFLYEIPIYYDPIARINRIKTFFENTFSIEDQKSIQEFIGDCLQTTYKYKKALMLVGPTDTGKSQFLSLLGLLLGKKNICHVSLYELCKDRFSAIDLYGKLANICADIDATGIRATKVFLMVTGGDRIRGQKKHQDAFNFLNYAKLVYSCNKIPESENKDPSYYNRWLVIECDNVIPKEERIPFFYKTIATEEELSGLINYGLEGLERLEKNGCYSEHRTLEEIKEFMESHKKPIPEFARDFIIFEKESEITKTELYKKYCEFCNLFAYPVKANNVFSREIKTYLPIGYDEGQSRKIKGRPKIWRGIKCTWDRGNQQQIITDNEQEEN